MSKEVNVYSFYDESYVYLGDYKILHQEKDNLIKCLEDKIRELRYNIYKYDTWHEMNENKEFMTLQVSIYQDILERVKSGKYD